MPLIVNPVISFNDSPYKASALLIYLPNNNKQLGNPMKYFSLFISVLALSACQTQPTNNTQLVAGVGTSYFHIVDADREEILTSNTNDNREILVKLWYPADISADQIPVPMWFHTQEHVLPFSNLDTPTEAITKLLNTPSKSYLNAKPSAGEFPLVVFSHGYWSFLEQNQYLMEHLAQQGYIVASVGHNHQAAAMMQTSGEMAFIDAAARDSDWFLASDATVDAQQLNEELDNLRGANLTEVQKNRVYQLTEWAAGDRQWIDYWVQDMSKALQVLTQVNHNDFSQVVNASMDLTLLSHHIDLDNISAVGGSMGGPAALDFCNITNNCKAAVNFDAAHYNLQRPQQDKDNYRKPYMVMLAGEGIPAAMSLIMAQQKAETYVINVAGATHMNFTDNSILNNSDLGPIDGQRMVDLMNLSVSGFIAKQYDRKSSGDDFLEFLQQQPEFTVHYQTEP